MRKTRRALAGMLAAGLLLGSVPYASAADGATRGEVARMVLAAADDYNPGVKLEDILQGDDSGDLRENAIATRAEALVMLQRAFGDLPAPVGDNARAAIPAGNFTDIPSWAKEGLADVFEAGIVAGTSETTFGASDPVTADQVQRFIGRVYALEGSNLKDDFYATINKQALEQSTIPDGMPMSGTLYDMMYDNSRVSGIIQEAAAGTQEKGSPKQKIGDFYNNILNWDVRNKEGIAPIKPYLDLVDQADTLEEVLDVADRLQRELYMAGLRQFSVTIDAKDSDRYIVTFSSISPSLSKDVYEKDSGREKEAFLRYVKALLVLGGYAEDNAERQVQLFWDADKMLSAEKMERQDYSDVDKSYHIYTYEQLKEMFPKADLDSAYQNVGLAPTDKILVSDVGLLEAAAPYFDEKHVDFLKVRLRVEILAGWGGMLNREFQTAADTYQNEMLGTTGTVADEYRAAQMVQQQFGTELGKIYAEKYFSPKAKADVTDMVQGFLEIYEQRIQGLTWMSGTTKARAIEKLKTMSVKVGYPDDGQWDDTLDAVEIKTAAEGGSYFDNMLEIARVRREETIKLQNDAVDKSKWAMNVYTVNACYIPTFNEVILPAGILRAPMYDVNNTREQNLGAIGYIIAHEITHAFDNHGSKFDKDGKAADWWTAEDHAAFQKLCGQVVEHYNGAEGSNGVACNGEQTLSENIADLGAAACVTEAAKREENPDFKQLYETMAKSWLSAAPREYRQYAASIDVHAPDKLRVNRVLVNLPEFYEAFDIQPGDGMYVAPEDRVLIW